jgi:S1-C subfamily serine protease
MAKWAIAVFMFLFAGDKPATLTPKEIFERNDAAVVQIFVNNELSGCGFIVSADGLIITANHVVTTEESHFTETYSNIEVRIPRQRTHPATVVAHSDVSDSAVLRIIVDGLPHVILEDSKAIEPSAPVAMITFLPDSRWNVPLLVTGSVSGTAMVRTERTQVNAVILQMPIRKDFSGSPIFNQSGKVIGIVSTRLIGISADLDIARKQLSGKGPVQVTVKMGPTDIGKTFLGLINSLDADLVSGLGSAVDISYAKEMLAEIQNQKN